MTCQVSLEKEVIAVNTPKFSLGHIVATPGVLAALAESGQMPEFFLGKHANADWGEVSPDDWRLNDQALIDGDRILSTYRTLKGVKLRIITEGVGDDGKRASTCVLLPDEY